MILVRQKLLLRQYIKGKLHKFQNLLEGYVKMFYGKEMVDGQLVAKRVVLEMIKPLTDSGRTLFTVWCTSITLRKFIKEVNSFCGNVRFKQKNLSKSAVRAKLKKAEKMANK